MQLSREGKGIGTFSPNTPSHTHIHTPHTLITPPSLAYLGYARTWIDHLLLAGIATSQDTGLALARTMSPVSSKMRVFVAADSIQDLHMQR